METQKNLFFIVISQINRLKRQEFIRWPVLQTEKEKESSLLNWKPRVQVLWRGQEAMPAFPIIIIIQWIPGGLEIKEEYSFGIMTGMSGIPTLKH